MGTESLGPKRLYEKGLNSILLINLEAEMARALGTSGFAGISSVSLATLGAFAFSSYEKEVSVDRSLCFQFVSFFFIFSVSSTSPDLQKRIKISVLKLMNIFALLLAFLSVS